MGLTMGKDTHSNGARRVVVTGTGVVTPIGNDVATFWSALKEGKSGEELFFELALEDLTRAADLFRPVWDRTRGVDGWVSLEVSPLLAHDTNRTLAAARDLHQRGSKTNLFIFIFNLKE